MSNIAATVGVLGAFIWWAIRLLLKRLDHIDKCLDSAKVEAIKKGQEVKTELLQRQDQVRDELLAQQQTVAAALATHVTVETPHLARIDRTLAWMVGKMGWSPQDFGPENTDPSG